MEIGKILKKIRDEKKMSQEQFAALIDVNDKNYGDIERGKGNPTLATILKICRGLNISLLEFVLYDDNVHESMFHANSKAAKVIADSLKKGMDIHFNRNVIMDKCESSIWYNGYIGSVMFDEFEMMLFAEGNVKASLYVEYKEVLELNTFDVSVDLSKYIKDDETLFKYIEYMPYDNHIIERKKGNVLFVEECNWLSATIINKETNETIESEIILDADNIYDAFGSGDILLDNM